MTSETTIAFMEQTRIIMNAIENTTYTVDMQGRGDNEFWDAPEPATSIDAAYNDLGRAIDDWNDRLERAST